MHESFGLDDLFNTLITLEETGETLYRQFAAELTDTKAQEIFLHLSNQERMHKVKYSTMRATHEFELPSEEEYSEFIGVLIKSTFSITHTNISLPTKEQAIAIGIRLEKDTLTFLDSVVKILGSLYVTDLTEIIAQEKMHLKLLEAL
jgi:rubrerythrin